MHTTQLEDPVFMNLRLDGALHEQLIEAAKRSVRSLNGEILYRLRSSFDRQETAAA
jgi:predicted HicB family RNase H-like nuclease